MHQSFLSLKIWVKIQLFPPTHHQITSPPTFHPPPFIKKISDTNNKQSSPIISNNYCKYQCFIQPKRDAIPIQQQSTPTTFPTTITRTTGLGRYAETFPIDQWRACCLQVHSVLSILFGERCDHTSLLESNRALIALGTRVSRDFTTPPPKCLQWPWSWWVDWHLWESCAAKRYGSAESIIWQHVTLRHHHYHPTTMPLLNYLSSSSPHSFLLLLCGIGVNFFSAWNQHNKATRTSRTKQETSWILLLTFRFPLPILGKYLVVASATVLCPAERIDGSSAALFGWAVYINLDITAPTPTPPVPCNVACSILPSTLTISKRQIRYSLQTTCQLKLKLLCQLSPSSKLTTLFPPHHTHIFLCPSISNTLSTSKWITMMMMCLIVCCFYSTPSLSLSRLSSTTDLRSPRTPHVSPPQHHHSPLLAPLITTHPLYITTTS